LSENITSKSEIANKKLAQELTRHFRSENGTLKEELSVKIQAEVQNLSESCNKLNTETDLKNVHKTIECKSEHVKGRLNALITGTT
jgi:hemerythrin-like domain-containing protein